jgi:hypothetical protein
MSIRIDIPQDIIDKAKSMYDDELMDKYGEGYNEGFDDAKYK